MWLVGWLSWLAWLPGLAASGLGCLAWLAGCLAWPGAGLAFWAGLGCLAWLAGWAGVGGGAGGGGAGVGGEPGGVPGRPARGGRRGCVGERSSNFGSAAVLSATWWDLSEWVVGPQVCSSRDQRYAARLRGALALLRKDFGDEATLLLPLYLPHRNAILEALNSLPKQEEISLDTTSSDRLEEE